jgi:predicted ester cyclase
MAPSTPNPERVARDYLTMWNDRAYERIPRLVSASFVMYDPMAPGGAVPGPAGQVHGPDGLETFIRGVVTGFPDFAVTVHRLCADEGAIMYEGELTMSHDGTYFGVPPTRRRAEVRYMGLIVVDGERVEAHHTYPPIREIADQLGFTSLAVVPYLPRLLWGMVKRYVLQK